jgi:trans-aconitate methyltransferase
MNRTLEPELMDDPEQALIYAQADFEQENQGFVDRFRDYFPDFSEGHVFDLGCGPGDIPIRFARLFPSCRITGVDASAPMVRLAEDIARKAGLSDRMTFRCERFQDLAGVSVADAAISNSLLHHVPNPPEDAQAIVDRYASDAPDILRRDFYHSLLAAFTEDEIGAQLAQMNLTRLLIDVVDDRHWVVGGLIH